MEGKLDYRKPEKSSDLLDDIAWPAPREDFARWLASGRTAARIRGWVVYRLPAVEIDEAMDSRLEAVYGFARRGRTGGDAWFWSMFESECESGWRHKPDLNPLCLHDRATGRAYHASRDAQPLFETASDWNDRREPERKLVDALHDRARAIAAELLAEPSVVENALEAFDDSGGEVFSKDELTKLMGGTFVTTGGFDQDFVADTLSRCRIDEPWGLTLVELLVDEDRAARRRADALLAENAAWLGTAIRSQREWNEAVREHGDEVVETWAPNASMHAAVSRFDAKKVSLVFRTRQGAEAVAKIKRDELLVSLEEQCPLRIRPSYVDQLDDCSGAIAATREGARYFDPDRLVAIRFRGKDVWVRSSLESSDAAADGTTPIA